jgi:hypothetical protein
MVNEESLASDCPASRNIAPSVANHEATRDIQIEVYCSLDEETWCGLATLT